MNDSKFKALAAFVILTGFVAVMSPDSKVESNVGQSSRSLKKQTKPTVLTDDQRVDLMIRMIQSHPLPEISKDLYVDLKEGRAVYSFSNIPGLDAVFASSSVQMGNGGKAEVKSYPTFVFGDQLFEYFLKDQVLAHLILSHENVHYQQWLKCKTDECREQFVPSKKDRSSKECRNLLGLEQEAYLIECKLAKEWGVSDRMSFCQHANNQSIFAEVIYEKMNKAKGYNVCKIIDK